MSLLDSLRAAAEHPELGDKDLKECLDRVAQMAEEQDDVISRNSTGVGGFLKDLTNRRMDQFVEEKPLAVEEGER
jgi:hypothetical protein